ncbi:alpha-glucoside transport system permease protein [Hasllibacter halocynthiae]|uniref:Alpha-glucoside transport system permease protein n=1 Tax=Hasllibacter halocynthiae TaxID=595589 RepID=A0A2T0X8L3_9RHOB|nr:sugar ABC transporter permease [Hasllibacter halocynthiae]PRY95273.1 alpha-glucoside transport system permease protein [Hasllibacter halocynthiae]
MNPALQGLITIIVGVGGCVGYFYLSNIVLDRFIFPPKAGDAGRNIRRAEAVRPWLFLFPAMFALGLYLAYPVFETLRLSLSNRLPGGRSEFVGFENYAQMFGEPKFGEALRNNMLWLVVVPAASTAIGLLVAQLTDRIRWGTVAKSLIFMPMAISFVGAAVIFKLIYEARAADAPQIGILNAVWLQFEGGIGSFLFLRLLPIILFLGFAAILAYVAWILVRPILRGDGGGAGAVIGRLFAALVMVWLGAEAVLQALDVATFEFDYGQPQTWLTIPFWNNFFLMIVLIWIQTGFAMVILSAALRGIPEETVEAAIVDGANPFQVFFQIKIPQIMGTIVVVWTTITITVLKVFDIVFAMTNGQWETQVLANYMYDKLFRANDWGIGSAAAMIIMLLVTPILVWNVYNARKEMR